MRVVHAIVGVPGIANAKVTDMVPEDRRIAGLIDGPTRQGLYGGLVLGVFEMAVLFVGNLILPATAHGWASSQPVGLGLLALYAAAFVLIGARGEQRAGTKWAGARAGAVAGFVVAALFVVTFAILFNVFYATMIRHPGHLGVTRASLNGTLLSAAFLMPALVTPVAALLGEFGGSFVVARREIRGEGRPRLLHRCR
jgi:hypothetical protein